MTGAPSQRVTVFQSHVVIVRTGCLPAVLPWDGNRPPRCDGVSLFRRARHTVVLSYGVTGGWCEQVPLLGGPGLTGAASPPCSLVTVKPSDAPSSRPQHRRSGA